MSAPPPPIPAAIWRRILAFLRAGGTGKIVLDAHRGTVQDGWINERIRAEEDETSSEHKD